MNSNKFNTGNKKYLKSLYSTFAMKQMIAAGYDRRKAYKLLKKEVRMYTRLRKDNTLGGLFIFSNTKQGNRFWYDIINKAKEKGLDPDMYKLMKM